MLTAQVKSLLRDLDIRARKSLGQHFLVDRSVLRRIVSAADIAPDDTIVEVGPGLGILTLELARRAGRVIAVEVDARLADALRLRLAASDNVSVVSADMLQTSPAALLEAGGILGSRYKVVANLPYYIASPLMRHFLESKAKPSRMVVMVQKEVGEAIAAQPGKMSLLAVSVQFYGQPVLVGRVPAWSFYPPPKVDSTILRIDLYERPKVRVADVDQFFAVVRAGFSAPRKQLRNALAQGLGTSPPETADLLKRAGIDPRCRGQTLSVQQWAELYEVVRQGQAAHG